ncbi:TetR/AcrR family transcriptional regulator [uncultured Trichococcus sp.]|uniref:TetR/AcrR family transcriptional regulator n=1 Tax=uncultured Trichococcus sp. TaxID=189665 RepID=UPI002A1884B4|nr:TetR/AcrR family transcriptional regulator [uncultured Trichococcus sp.]
MKSQTLNEFVKECIADALVKVMASKSFNDITITEIVSLADVGRATYYRNFSSKDDILYYKITLLLSEWLEKIPPNVNRKEKTTLFFKFLQSEKELLELIYKHEKGYIILDSYLNMPPDLRHVLDEQNIMDIFYIYGVFGITEAWIKNGMLEDPEELASILLRKIHPTDGSHVS